MSSRLKISLALLVGFSGLGIAGANLPVDTQLTIRTKLGKRTQPHWLVPQDSKIVRTEGGSGLLRLLGGLLGCAGFGTAMHLAGEDERQQRLLWAKQIVFTGVQQQEDEVTAQIGAGVRLKKLQMDAQADVDFYSLQIQSKFREAIGFAPTPFQPALPHGKPGTLDEINNPGDKIDANEQTEIAIGAGQSITKVLLESQIAGVVLAGLLKLIGTPGSGKTTLTSALLRCRIENGHQLIIINSHKRKSMYQYIEPFLVYGTSIYGVGVGDKKRAESLKDGLDKILEILSSRYDEYQNQDEDTYNHFPITLLLEEIGEWEPLLALTMPASEVEILLQHFWRKLFIAARKGKFFPLITAQTDTQAMFKAKGLSGLFKESGAVTLNLSAVPDPKSKDGWKPSELASLKLPNRLPVDVIVPDVRSLIFDLDDFADCQQHATNTGGGEVVESLPVSTTPPPPVHPNLHRLETLMHQDSTSLHPVPENWQFPDPMQPLTPEVRAVVVSCKRASLSQNAAILAIWGLVKSGSDKRYEAARLHWQQVILK